MNSKIRPPADASRHLCVTFISGKLTSADTDVIIDLRISRKPFLIDSCPNRQLCPKPVDAQTKAWYSLFQLLFPVFSCHSCFESCRSCREARRAQPETSVRFLRFALRLWAVTIAPGPGPRSKGVALDDEGNRFPAHIRCAPRTTCQSEACVGLEPWTDARDPRPVTALMTPPSDDPDGRSIKSLSPEMGSAPQGRTYGDRPRSTPMVTPAFFQEACHE